MSSDIDFVTGIIRTFPAATFTDDCVCDSCSFDPGFVLTNYDKATRTLIYAQLHRIAASSASTDVRMGRAMCFLSPQQNMQRTMIYISKLLHTRHPVLTDELIQAAPEFHLMLKKFKKDARRSKRFGAWPPATWKLGVKSNDTKALEYQSVYAGVREYLMMADLRAMIDEVGGLSESHAQISLVTIADIRIKHADLEARMTEVHERLPCPADSVLHAMLVRFMTPDNNASTA
jgi:hypothetical protein